MDIIFLGTGGGRFNLLKQIRGTGGFRINSHSANIQVDPGPGALVHSLKLKQDPLKLDALIVTHNHIDHVNDANVFVEALSQHTLKKQGIIIGSKNVLEGDENRDIGITRYHQGHVAQIYTGKWGERRKFRTKKGEFEIEIVKTKHDEPTAFGFKLYLDGKIIGYTTDTEPFEGIAEAYAGCDVLIMNCLKPEKDRYKGHLETRDCIEIVKSAKPKMAVLTHLGMKMICPAGQISLDSNFSMISVADKEAEKIEKETGIHTIAASDGTKLEI